MGRSDLQIDQLRERVELAIQDRSPYNHSSYPSDDAFLVAKVPNRNADSRPLKPAVGDAGMVASDEEVFCVLCEVISWLCRHQRGLRENLVFHLFSSGGVPPWFSCMGTPRRPAKTNATDLLARGARGWRREVGSGERGSRPCSSCFVAKEFRYFAE